MIKIQKPKGGNYQQTCLLHPNGMVFCKKHTNVQFCAECHDCSWCTHNSLERKPAAPKKKIAMTRTRPARVQAGPQFMNVKASDLRVGDEIERSNHRDPSEKEIVTVREIREVRLRSSGSRGYLVLHDPAFYLGSFTVKAHEEVAIIKRPD